MWVVIVEILAALMFSNRKAQNADQIQTPKTVVLIPAHNEQSGISDTLDSLLRDLPDNTHILCVAHNCTDATADIVREFDAEVIEINDSNTGGKPDAIKAGLRYLDSDPPEIVVIIDADCLVSHGTIRLLATQAKSLDLPVMGSYFFTAPEQRQRTAKMSILAIMLKNFIRPLGLHKLGLPCLLNGSGSAYPFHVIRDVPHGEGSIAEDYQLTVDLLNKGYPTTFEPMARLSGQLPVSKGTAQKQRRRWEHGHLYLSFHTAPRLLLAGLIGLDRKRIALGFELLVPPLAYLGLIWMLTTVIAIILAIFFDATPLYMLLSTAIIFFLALLLSFLRFAGVTSTLAALAVLPNYVMWKLPIYRDFFIRRETRWIKTDRD